MNPILDSEQAAKLLKCTVKTIEDRARRGDLPGEKFGESWVFPTEAFLAAVNEIAVRRAADRRRRTQPSAVKIAASSKASGRPCLTNLG